MRENELDLDAILADFHAEERRPAAPVESPAPRRRRAESAPAPREEAPAAAAPQPRRERFAAPDPEQSEDRTERLPRPAQKPKIAAKAERERRPASRKSAGRLRMAAVLAALLAVLAGMLFWVSREEQKTAAQEPEPIRMELGQALEDYLDHAATTSYG